MRGMKVCMIGLGYIGLPGAAVIANKGIDVLGVDIREDVVDKINRGEIHIVEPGLEDVVKQVTDQGFLKADIKPAEADIFIVAVPTPFKENNKPDLRYVEAAIDAILPFLQKDNLIIIESTSPVGTTESMARRIFDIKPELKGELHLAYCPERVLPGNVLFELENNDRVIGGIEEPASIKARDFYSHFVTGEMHLTNARTAEMCKLVENSCRDNSIAFANELSIICDEADINVWELIELANKHPRINILQPGTGVGGHCIAVDPWFLVSEFGNKAKLIRQSRELNDYKTDWVIEKIKNSILTFRLDNGSIPKVGILGLAFKPNIDDLRESPAVRVATELREMPDIELYVSEPNISTHPHFELADHQEIISSCDILCFLVKHKEYIELEIKLSPKSVVHDFCGAQPKLERTTSASVVEKGNLS